MELNRKLVTVILVMLIIIVPIAAFAYVVYRPANLESISLDSVSPDTSKADGVYVIATARGSGAAFDSTMNLQVYFANERIYTGKVDFTDGYANHKLFYEDFSVGNGKYEFRLIHEDLSDRYDFEMDQVAEEISVVSAATYNLQGSGHQPWEALYSYHVVFKTGWNFFTYKIDRNEFASHELGYQFEGSSAPLKVSTGPEHGCAVEVYFTNPSGVQSRIHQFDVPAGETFETTIEFALNGSYLYKYLNKKTVTIEIEAYENRAVDKIPSGGQIIVTQKIGTNMKEDVQLISEIDQVSGFVRPDFGPGNYTMTIDYPNPQVRDGHGLSTLSFTEVVELNDKPRAIGRVNPGQISTLQRTVTFDATDSFDDGPKTDLTVFWFFGATSSGEYIGEGSAEGPWETHKTYTFTYPLGVNPDVTNGKPYLILIDAYGAESAKYEINLAVS